MSVVTCNLAKDVISVHSPTGHPAVDGETRISRACCNYVAFLYSSILLEKASHRISKREARPNQMVL